jgi:hypothetical protein
MQGEGLQPNMLADGKEVWEGRGAKRDVGLKARPRARARAQHGELQESSAKVSVAWRWSSLEACKSVLTTAHNCVLPTYTSAGQPQQAAAGQQVHQVLVQPPQVPML